jgi:general secretion pathway protein H
VCLLKFSTASNNHGFTLIELIVVMALITTMTAFAIPKIRSSLFTNQLRATARQFIGLVAEVGQQARAKRSAVVLRYDQQERIFTTTPESKIVRDTTKGYSSIRVGDGVEVVDVATAHGGKKDLGMLAIRFNDHGYVDKTVVHFRDEDGEQLSIILSPFLGVTRVLEGYVTLDEDRFSAAGN